MNLNRRVFLQAAGPGLGALRAAGAGLVTVRVLASDTGRPTPSRVRLLDGLGRELVPEGHPAALKYGAQEGDVRFQSRRYSYVNGEFMIAADSLPVRYQILKGFEYLIAEGEIPERARQGVHTVTLQRWSEVGRDGWRGGDIHIHHIAPGTCRLEMEAEDLNVANILTSDFTTDQERFEGRVNAASTRERLIYYSQEFRNHQLGHLCLLNLKELVEPVRTVQAHHYPLHLRVCDRVHEQGGYVSWAHFPSWPGVECPLDVAMEKLDGLEILCVLEPRALPVFMKQVVPELESNDGLRLWYRYLNCGFRLTATAGTDKMTTFVTVGSNRVYARLNGEFTFEKWIEALQQGRTFITNSPLLAFTVNGQEAGTTLRLDSGRQKLVEIHARAQSQLPYRRLEIVRNGEVVAEASPSGPRHRAEIHLELPLRGSCWVAARAMEDVRPYLAAGVDFSQVHSEGGTRLSDLYGTRRPETVFAHTSPLYVLVDSKPIRSWEDAQYYARYLDNAIRWLETDARFASAADKKASIEAFRMGKAIYEARAREAREKAGA